MYNQKEVTGEIFNIQGFSIHVGPGIRTVIFALCKERGLHTAIETCGFGSWNNFSKILAHTDLVLYDFKHMDSEQHKAGTGVGNELILENAVRICKEAKKNLIARVPVIPDLNDTESNMKALAEFILHKLEQPVKVHLLPYHQLGESKISHLEKTEERTQVAPPSDAHMESLRSIVAGYGLEVIIGG